MKSSRLQKWEVSSTSCVRRVLASWRALKCEDVSTVSAEVCNGGWVNIRVCVVQAVGTVELKVLVLLGQHLDLLIITDPVICPKASHRVCDMGLCGHTWGLM